MFYQIDGTICYQFFKPGIDPSMFNDIYQGSSVSYSFRYQYVRYLFVDTPKRYLITYQYKTFDCNPNMLS